MNQMMAYYRLKKGEKNEKHQSFNGALRTMGVFKK